MDDHLEHLLKTLRLKRIREIIERELEKATERKPSYTEFLVKLLQEEDLAQKERGMQGYLHDAHRGSTRIP